MNWQLILFILAGSLSMSAALSAGSFMKQAQREGNVANLPKAVLLWGNLGALLLILTLVMGALEFAWWINLSALFISFPALHFIVLQRVLTGERAPMLATVTAAACLLLWGSTLL
ncbi:hypothetical protein [Balneatrix alpica]|uniref:NADH dehydrogenase subunit 2 n=1 Tax=Balneatrix alpica TaxID=75684 RepID=A0ABV5Z8M5_9GAMM|nr:hypothetical protein [Balneatrix alpica]